MNGGGKPPGRLPKQDTELLDAALIGFQHMRDQIAQKITDIRSQLAAVAKPESAAALPGASMSKKRTISAAARRRIALAQKKRWAAFKAAQGTTAAAPKPKKRAAAKNRWA